MDVNTDMLRCSLPDDGSAYVVVQDSSLKRRILNDTACCNHPRTLWTLPTVSHIWVVTSAHAVVTHQRCWDVLVSLQVSRFMAAVKTKFVHQAATVQRPSHLRPTVWRRNLDPQGIRWTETRGFPDVVLTTDSWNTLVRLCAKRVSDEPDSAAKHLQQNPWQTIVWYFVPRLCSPNRHFVPRG